MPRIGLLMIGTLIEIQVFPAVGQDHRDDRQVSSSASGAPTGESGIGEHYYCRITEMPISWETSSQAVKIAHSDAVFNELGLFLACLSRPSVWYFTAGTQPCRGIVRWAHRDDERGREDSFLRRPPPIGSKDPMP
jgi:hypothetical protein